MKKLLLVIIGIVVLVFLNFNHAPDGLNGENVDSVSISYGVRSYLMLSTDEDKVKDLIKQFRNLSFEPTDKKMDIMTMLTVSFYQGEKSIASFKVDENGVFWLGGKTKGYKLSSGSFDYNFVRNIYLESIGD